MDVWYDTELTITGRPEELTAMLRVLARYTYRNHDFWLDYHRINGRNYPDAFPEEGAWADLVANGRLEITADGPWSEVITPTGTRLFLDLADAAPKAAFQAKVVGGMDFYDEELTAVLKEGRLETILTHDEDETINCCCKRTVYDPVEKNMLFP